jgi:hypothetical protein
MSQLRRNHAKEEQRQSHGARVPAEYSDHLDNLGRLPPGWYPHSPTAFDKG